MTTTPARRATLPHMLQSLARGATVPSHIFIVAPSAPTSCPAWATENARRWSPWRSRILTLHFVEAPADRGPIEKYLGAADEITASAEDATFLLILDDDHEYDAGVVASYADALRAAPDVAFTVTSPPSEHKGYDPRFPIAYGSRGVAMRLDLALDGSLANYAAKALRLEPLCRVVDDLIVSSYLFMRGVEVRDVPGYSFHHRPWKTNTKLHKMSKPGALRRHTNRDPTNIKCHDALVSLLERRANATQWKRRRAAKRRALEDRVARDGGGES